jgi:hypothetical protein
MSLRGGRMKAAGKECALRVPGVFVYIFDKSMVKDWFIE